MSEGLFRKAALDKVSSPEQLDLLMRVTSPIGWLALVTVGVMVATATAWSVVGTVSDLVDSNGTLFVGERVRDTTATMGGTILELKVRPGAIVKKGQVVATLQRDQAGIEQREADEATIQKDAAMAARKRQELATLQRSRAVQKELVDQGIKAPKELLNLDREIDAVRGQIDQLEIGIRQLQAKKVSTAVVEASWSGRVTEVLKAANDKVRENEPLFRVEPEGLALQGQPCGGRMHVILYVPAALQGRIMPGQLARVSPSGVKKEEFGFIFGKVESISRSPASSADMSDKLKNDQLVATFQNAGPVHEMRVCLEWDPANKVNGLKWSSSEGPPKKIDPFTTCTASVVVEERKPYTYVIPAVKRTVGF